MSMQEEFNAAINFALDKAGPEGLVFLHLWREGCFPEIQKEFPEFEGPFPEVTPQLNRRLVLEQFHVDISRYETESFPETDCIVPLEESPGLESLETFMCVLYHTVNKEIRIAYLRPVLYEYGDETRYSWKDSRDAFYSHFENSSAIDFEVVIAWSEV
jgi:hypothetical protein